MLKLLSYLLLINNSFAKEETFTFVDEGRKVPFSGVLLSPEATTEIILYKQTTPKYYENECNFRVEKIKSEYMLTLDNKNARIEALETGYKAEIKAKQEVIDELKGVISAQKPDRKWLFLAGGVVMGFGISYGTIKLGLK